MWNHVYGARAAIQPLTDVGHRRIDCVARDAGRGLDLSIEHGLLLTVPQSREAERFVELKVKPRLRDNLTGRLAGSTRMRLATRESRVPQDVADRVLRAVEADPTLLTAGSRELRDGVGLLGWIAVDASPGLARRLYVGPSADITKEAALAGLEVRLAGLVLEEREKYEAGAIDAAPATNVSRLLLVEADDWVNMSDPDYSRVFDAAATSARASGLRSMWRVAADGGDQVHYWLEWDAEEAVLPRRRFFSWMERSDAVEEL